MVDKADKLFNLLIELEMSETAQIFRKEYSKLNNISNKEIVINRFYNLLNNNLDKPNNNNIVGNKLNDQENNKIMNNLIYKISKKTDSNLNLFENLSKTTIFTKLLNKIDNQDRKLAEVIQKTIENEERFEEDELPHFGGSSKKFETYKNTLDEENNARIANPNNTLKESNYEDSIFENDFLDSKAKISNKFQAPNQLDNMIKGNFINTNSENIDSSSFFQNTHSLILQNDDFIDEYVDDDDPGFDLYECEHEFFKETCKKLSEQYDFPKRAIIKSINKNQEKKKDNENLSQILKSIKTNESNKKNKNGEQIYEIDNNNIRKTLLGDVKFMESANNYYPLQYNNVVLDCFNLKVVVDRERTGFEESKEFKIIVNSLIAGRYQVISYLGSAAFSKAIKCLDIVENRLVCLKIIENNKDYFDQSIDEIKLLRYINANGDPDENYFLKLYDYFYHKEHLFIVTEILKDNLYEFYKYTNENNLENYFNLNRLKIISKQILMCLSYIHSLKLVHCDLKPENILIKSITDTSVKVIDFGSSCYIHDHLSSYIQSRSYRAPEVILGCKYDYKIDIWSFGCIVAELYTGNVLFQNDSIQSLLARIIGIIGPIPDWMYEKGRLANDYFTKEKLIYMEVNESANNTGDNVFSNLSKSHNSVKGGSKNKKMHILIPKRTQLKKRLKTNDDLFLDFVKSLLEIDPNNRPTAKEALKHQWLAS